MKLLDQKAALSLIHDGDTIAFSGLLGAGFAEYMAAGMEASFLETGHPANLSLIYASGIGDGQYTDHGANRFAHPGMLKRVICSHYKLSPKLQDMVDQNLFEAYLFAQDTITQNFRESAAGRPGVISKTGLGTFVDPRQEGGKCNAKAQEDLVELITLGNEEYLWYKPYHIQVAIIRATASDENGNLIIDKEAILLNQYYLAALAKKCGGIVIAQVERIVKDEALSPREIYVPGFLVDYVVEAPLSHHWQTYAGPYNDALAQKYRVPVTNQAPMPMDERKIVARRAALELKAGGVINLGMGLPVGIVPVAEEEGIQDEFLLSIDTGHTGGIPLNGSAFGCSLNPEVTVEILRQLDFYNSGGLDRAFLGAAEIDFSGNVNVSKVGKVIGPGAFMGIAQYTKRLVFCSTFTGGGLKTAVHDGQLQILKEGRIKKIVPSVQQITFSSDLANQTGQQVLYVTERCVFELTEDGLMLTEIAPGIDLQSQILDLIDGEIRISEHLKLMDSRIFNEAPMGLKLS